ncbi:MAG: GIY-YIG nuclease family protein, partial [Candidatus Curtissbacteria bacterium]
RTYEHRNGSTDGFTKKYKLKKLIYFEQYNEAKEAIAREKQLKNWHRDWKINLIKSTNPELADLDPEINSG